MGRFSKGDKVAVTNPMQPTGHKGGETGTVTKAETVDFGTSKTDLVEIRQDADGQRVTCYPSELSHR
jgi:hypothetical protein